MERSKHLLIRVLIALSAISAAKSDSKTLKCASRYNSYYDDYRSDNDNQCIINHLIINSTEIASLRFPIRESIVLNKVQIDYLSQEVMDRMKWVSNLKITSGRIGRIYLKADLQKLSAERSETTELIIDDSPNDYLEELIITSNKLKTLPENLNKLNALTTLSLENNNIDVVHLNKLSGLEKLTNINLSNNRIYHLVPVDEGGLNLTRLKVFDLTNNYLRELNFELWDLPRLQILKLSSNQLMYLKNLDVNTFPFLQDINLSDNLFDCRWRDEFFTIYKNITKAQSLDCAKTTQLSLLTYKSLNISDQHSFEFQFDNKEQLEEQINEIIKTGTNQLTQIQALSALVANQEKLISDGNEKLLAQEALIDGLLVQFESLSVQMDQLKQMDVQLVGKSVPKGMTEKLIQAISDVIRKHLVDEA